MILRLQRGQLRLTRFTPRAIASYRDVDAGGRATPATVMSTGLLFNEPRRKGDILQLVRQEHGEIVFVHKGLKRGPLVLFADRGGLSNKERSYACASIQRISRWITSQPKHWA